MFIFWYVLILSAIKDIDFHVGINALMIEIYKCRVETWTVTNAQGTNYFVPKPFQIIFTYYNVSQWIMVIQSGLIMQSDIWDQCYILGTYHINYKPAIWSLYFLFATVSVISKKLGVVFRISRICWVVVSTGDSHCIK